jgi:hypothetical protein
LSAQVKAKHEEEEKTDQDIKQLKKANQQVFNDISTTPL